MSGRAVLSCKGPAFKAISIFAFSGPTVWNSLLSVMCHNAFGWWLKIFFFSKVMHTIWHHFGSCAILVPSTCHSLIKLCLKSLIGLPYNLENDHQNGCTSRFKFLHSFSDVIMLHASDRLN